jgi:integrase
MATIRKRTGARGTRWQAIVRRGGQAESKSFGTKREATEWAAAVETAINKDEFTVGSEARRHTVGEMIDRYRRSVLPRKGDTKNEARYLDHWEAELGHLKIAAVTRAQIVETRDRMAETRAAGTVNRYLATLRHCFRIAMVDWEWATRNPCEKIALRERRGRDRHLDDDEIKRLLAATKASKHPQLHAIVLVALTTGARKGEVEGLRWSDVNLAKGRAILHKTKNTDKRTIALVDEVVAELRKIRKIRRIDDSAIFGTVNAPGKRTFSGFYAAWYQALDDAEIEGFRFHDLRHTFASRMAMSGATLTDIAAALGHRTLAMVQRYAHLTEQHVHEVSERTARGILGS